MKYHVKYGQNSREIPKNGGRTSPEKPPTAAHYTVYLRSSSLLLAKAESKGTAVGT